MELALEKRIEDTFRKEKKKLSNFIRSRISVEEDAEDILQEVFYQAVANANILETIDNLIAWLYTVAKNKIIDSYRKKKLPTVSINRSLNDNGSSMILEEIVEDTFTDIEDDYTRSLVYDEIIEAINELAAEQKEIFVANEIEGVSFREYSEKSGVSINTLLARKRYAVINLKKRLKEIKNLIDE